MKNILSYNCIRKPNIIQRNTIDCMELRSAEMRSNIIIRRTSRVYTLCVFRLLQHRHPSRDRMMSTSSPPSSFTVVPPCTKSILITCCIQILVTCCIRILVSCCIRFLVTCCILILVTCLFESSSHVYSNPRHMLYSNPSLTISTRIRHDGEQPNIVAVYKCRITSP